MDTYPELYYLRKKMILLNQVDGVSWPQKIISFPTRVVIITHHILLFTSNNGQKTYYFGIQDFLSIYKVYQSKYYGNVSLITHKYPS